MKVIVNIEDGLDPQHAVYLVATAMMEGMVSKSGKSRVPTFCFVTKFTDGTIVIARDRATEDSAHSFIVRKEAS